MLAGARLRPGEHVVDLGAGTGLLACAAAGRVGPTGAATALDISHAALRMLAPPDGGPVPRRVVADAARIPLADESADAVVTRSVLIYLPDLAGTLAEIARILRPHGRLSIFEPVNAGRRHDAHLDTLDPDELAAVEGLRAGASAVSSTMLAFDPATTATLAARAGLTVDTLALESVTDRLTDPAAIDAHLHRRPHPGAPTPLEHITTAFGGSTAARYRQAWHRSLTAHGPITFTTPVAYLTATKTA